MSKHPQRIRGTQDIFGEDADRFQAVVAAFERVRRLYAFSRVEMPVFEDTSVFARSIGETTDVVSKEMYTFEDRGGDSVTLRPEFTAGICRAYLSNGWQQHAPLKLVTHGPAFRYERPQKGRYRQFHQLDAEIIGAGEPAADVEMIAMGAQLLDELGISGRIELKLNTLGDPATRDAWRAALLEHFRSRQNDLSLESQKRLATNPLRILDSKEHQDWPIVDAAPVVDDYLTAEAADFFGKVTAGLDAAGVKWTRDPRLVRGLDYYRHTAFEFVTEDLGAQSAVLAGGRYDGLIESLGGPHTPAVGWAAGIERLGMLIERGTPELILAVVPDKPELSEATANLVTRLRARGLAVEVAYRGTAKRQIELAKKRGRRGAIIVRGDPFTLGGTHLSYFETDPSLRDEVRNAVVEAFRPDIPFMASGSNA
ncbi:MAG TPA: histidine--tRNA ligase [Allosphingosinicella sp.]|jgi:histidyl-tRNA synthetase